MILEYIANLSFWQFMLHYFCVAAAFWVTLYVATHAICKAYFEKKKEYIAFVASAAATAFTKYQKEMKKNN